MSTEQKVKLSLELSLEKANEVLEFLSSSAVLEKAAPEPAKNIIKKVVEPVAADAPKKRRGRPKKVKPVVEEETPEVQEEAVTPQEAAASEAIDELDQELDDDLDVPDADEDADGFEITEVLMEATKASAFYSELISLGCNDTEKVKEFCAKNQDKIPFLKAYGEKLPERVAKTCSVLFQKN